MATSKKQISISTNLSNNNEVFSNYSDYRQSIICRYSNSNYNTLINPVFTTFIDSVTNNDDPLINVPNINNYKSKSSFNLIYNINKSLKRFDDLIFNNCTTLTGVTHIPQSFKVIGRYAFNGCNALTYINLPSTINEVKEFAFNGTNNLKNLDISNITKLHNYSFAGCSLETFDLNNKIKTLYHYLFKDCKNMKQFTNNNIQLLGEGVFCGCTNLEYVELSNYKGIYELKDEYVETLETFGKRKTPYEIGQEYKVEFLDELGENVLYKGKIETIENISEDDFLFGLAKFVITECEDENLIGKIFYVGFELFDDIDGEYIHHCYYEDGTSVTIFTIRLEQEENGGEEEEKEPNTFILYDVNDNMIGKITKELYLAIKSYDDAHNNSLVSIVKNDETLLIQFKNDIRFIEYYFDGVTPTGNVYDSPVHFQSNDATQYIPKYKFYSNITVTRQNIIPLKASNHYSINNIIENETETAIESGNIRQFGIGFINDELEITPAEIEITPTEIEITPTEIEIIPTESETETVIETETQTETQSETETETNIETNTESETETETNTESETETQTDTESETETNTESETESETNTETNTESETQSETETNTESDIETHTEDNPAPATETETMPETETEIIEEYKETIYDIIQLTDDMSVNIVFNSDFTECYVKLNGYPVYDASQRYIGYYMYEPFLSIRKTVDENLVIKSGTNGNAYIDNGFYIKYEGIVAKYPVYNLNYCYLGRLNNGEWLEYTNQTELDTYASRLESFIVLDENEDETELQYFMMPASYNYGESDISEENIDATIAAINEIINEIIEFKTGTNPEEEEENIRQFNKFNIEDLEYDSDKYDLPNMLFASCINLNNDNIIKSGNYNSSLSHVNIKFTNKKESKNIYKGEWQDVIGFNYYNPSNAAYNYTFKWRYLTYLDKEYISISLNGKTYFITEEFNDLTNTYERKLVDNIYDTPNIIEDFSCNALTKSESIFKIDLFNKIYLMKMPKLQKVIYDNYYLLDTIENIGDNVFMNCASIENIRNKFKKIGSFAFKDCVNLKSIELNRTEDIGKFAFQNCTSLNEISLNYLTSLKNDGIFYNCTNLSTINNFSLSDIPDQMFKYCSSLNNIKMNNITKVNDEAFYGCTNLVIDRTNSLNNIKYFGDYAFAECKNIKSIEFNNHIENLGKGVFKYCTALENIELPSCIDSLPAELFYGCKNIKSIKFNTSINNIDLSGIDLCNNIESIHIPNGGRYITPDDSFIFDTENNEIIYICKNISVVEINNHYNDGTIINGPINISNTAFNNCKVSIIKISKDVLTPNINSNTFNGIKNETYHILIDHTDDKYDRYYELVGKNHIYYI